jgi:polygalacturonase
MMEGKGARREFLRVTGAGLVGAAAGNVALPASGTSPVPPSASDIHDVRAFGAKGDGKTLDTPAINKAIEAAAAAGGGTVVIAAGSYLCYSIHLKSNVEVYLGPGATIVAADPPAAGASGGYDPPEPNAWDKYQDFGHSHWHDSLIWGEDIANFSIQGPGLIWGKGLSRGGGDKALAAGVGNKSISLKNCHNVILRDFSILHGGHFGILATSVDNLTIDNLRSTPTVTPSTSTAAGTFASRIAA